MCSVGDMFDVDISGEATICEYACTGAAARNSRE